MSLRSVVPDQVSNGLSDGWVDGVAEDASVGAGSNLMVLKCPIFHARPHPLPISAAFLSESTPRLIREGIKLIGLDVSEPCITPKVLG
jgi:hypothetical protein